MRLHEQIHLRQCCRELISNVTMQIPEHWLSRMINHPSMIFSYDLQELTLSPQVFHLQIFHGVEDLSIHSWSPRLPGIDIPA